MNLVRIVCAGVLLLAGSAAAQQGARAIPATTISLGTATPGGGFPLYGNALAEVMNAADPALSIAPRNTKGSNENIPLLEKGELDIALVAGEPAYEALMGIGRPATPLKILAAIYSSPGMFVVRADSPFKAIRDLVGQRVAFGARGSGLPILSRYILDGVGLKQDEDFQSIYLDGLRDLARLRKLPITITEAQPGFVDTAMMKATRPFWVASPEVAARQILRAVRRRGKHAYITRRWAIAAWLLKLLPRAG